MRIRLTQKFADMLDGVDLKYRSVGDTFDLPDNHAQLLIAEAWAVAHATSDELHSPFRSATPNRSPAHAKKGRV